MNRRHFLSTLATLPAAAQQPAQTTTDPRPNLVVILCDDLGYGDLACFGNRTIRTPNIDQLAAEGIRFRSCYAAAPVCSPSRAGLLTGRTPYRSGIYDWIPDGSPMHLPKEEVTVASLLRLNGYATCHAGKWHCNGLFNSEDQPQPSDHGFDHWFATQNNAAPTHRDPKNFVRNWQEAGPLQGFSCQLVADEALRWVEDRDPSKPFFLNVCFHEPHEPIDSPERFLVDYATHLGEGEALYYANVANMDDAVGRIVRGLDEMGLGENTLIFFTSDNGPETKNRYKNAWRSWGTPGDLRGMKLHLYEGGIRVPGILRWTGHTIPGQICDEPIIGTDVLPTLCDAAGAGIPRDRPVDGASFLGVIRGQPVERRTPLYWQYDKALGLPKIAIRDGDWKLLAHEDLRTFELYNLRTDLTEKVDLSEREPQRVNRMARTLLAMRQAIAAEGPEWPEWKRP